MSKQTDLVIENLRKLRLQKKISVLKLSEESGISRSHIFYIETKKTSPSLDTLEKLCNALGIELKELFNPTSLYSLSNLNEIMAAEGSEESFYTKDK